MNKRNCEGCSNNMHGLCAVSMMSTDYIEKNIEGECPSRDGAAIRPKIIGFCGYARAGKDTSADIICGECPDYVKVSFANELKDECNAMMEATGRDIDFHREDDKVFYRDILVFWGKYCREHFKSDYWINKLERSMDWIKKCKDTNKFVVSDVRYPNEAEWIRKNGGIVIFIKRPWTTAANSEEKQTIYEIRKQKLYDFILDNDDTINMLRARIMAILGIHSVI